MAIQQTMSSQDGHLSEQTFGLLVILTGHINKGPEKKYIYTALRFKGTNILLLYVLACWGRIFLLLSYFFNIITGQKRDVTEITFLWWVSMTARSPQQSYFEPLDSISWVKWHSENSLLKNMHSVDLHFQFLYPNIGWQIWKYQTKIMLDLLGETGHR